MNESESFEQLRSRLEAGDDAAACAVFDRYARRLIGLARSRLNDELRQKVDPEEVMQSVFKSFFRRNADEPFDLQGWNSLWSLLAVMTLRKCGKQVKLMRAARRDVRREVAVHGTGDLDASWIVEAATTEPTPDEAVILAELLDAVMRDLDEREQKMVSMRLQGYTFREIATEVSRTERTVQRVLKQVKKRLLQQCGDE